MTEPLKTINVIVDRRVLAEMLKSAATASFDYDADRERWRRLKSLAEEVESGNRCELYARDWPKNE